MLHEGKQYGGAVNRNQFIRLVLALCLGTLVEWYDFSVYSQLSNIITRLFFPPGNATAAQLAFWGVYAVGYISRPVGALLFGHIGDAHGRRVTLLWSVLGITLPTLLIGCLPTYAMIGIAAPVLMAVLRCIQGLAVGGEFGSAIVYLFEVAPAGHKGFFASLGQTSVAPGMILGILVCQAMLYLAPHDALNVWGWRVPFLVTVFTAPLALVMRMHMPEPYEFLKDRQHQVLERVASTAAARVARTFSRQASLASAHSLHSISVRTGSLSKRGSSEPGGAAAAPARALSARQVSLRLVHLVSITDDGALAGSTARPRSVSAAAAAAVAAADAAAHGKEADGVEGHDSRAPRDRSLAAQTRQSGSLSLKIRHESADEPLPADCEQAFVHEVEELSELITHHVPLKVLFRDHWPALLLQIGLEACYGCSFYTVFSWVPPYLERSLHIKTRYGLWSVLIGLVLYSLLTPLTGHFVADRNVPKLWVYLAGTAVIATASLPFLVVLETGHPIGLWLLLPLLLGSTGVLGGIMTTIGPLMYPPAVRTSGYNLGHNTCMSVFGGLMPLIVSAMATVIKPATTAAGILIIFTALLSFVSGVILIKVVPATNAPCAAGAYPEFLLQQRKALEAAAKPQGEGSGAQLLHNHHHVVAVGKEGNGHL